MEKLELLDPEERKERRLRAKEQFQINRLKKFKKRKI